MVHSARDDALPVHVEVGTQHFVPMSLHPAENGDTMVSLHVPQSQVVVLGDGQQQVGVLGVKLEFVNALSMADVVLNAVHCGWTEYSNYAARASGGKHRFPVVRIVGPSTSVKILVSI